MRTGLRTGARSQAETDDNYFVFEELIKQTLLAFTRDIAIRTELHGVRPRVATGKLKGTGAEAGHVCYPPNGVIPFHGLAYFVAPLCFLYADPAVVYLVFSKLYTRSANTH